MVSIPASEAEGAVAGVKALLSDGEYRGVFSAEFKKDDRDGVFKILEVNARPWWFVEFAATCGMNLVEMAYRDVAGLPIGSTGNYALGKYLIHPYYDISACMREYPTRARGFFGFLGSIPGADRPVWNWKDPLPAFCEFAVLTKKFLERRIGKKFRR
jgi:predicted ATP-grasp superfamily ATP-dependent carboligase